MATTAKPLEEQLSSITQLSVGTRYTRILLMSFGATLRQQPRCVGPGPKRISAIRDHKLARKRTMTSNPTQRVS